MTPRQYEDLVAEHFRRQGYCSEVTPFGNDYGVDVFARRDNEKLAVQAKMYGGSARRINREMVMQLHGAKDYFDCTKAAIVTNGDVLESAREVARKLGIDILHLQGDGSLPSGPINEVRDIQIGVAQAPETGSMTCDFDAIWVRYVMPLAGQTLVAPDGRTNIIVAVDWAGVERVSSNGNRGRIPIEIFRKTVGRIFERGQISREEINDEYSKRAASGVVLVLAQVPLFEHTANPSKLRVRAT